MMMKKIYFKKRRKRGPVVSKKTTYDGINFASGLEKHMYIALKKAKITAKAKWLIVVQKRFYQLNILQIL